MAGFLSLLAVSSMPVAQLLLIGVAGAFLATARCNVLTATARADINRVVYAVFTPALMLASLATTVTLQDVISWWFMPVNIGIAFLVGGALGWLAMLVLRPPQHLRGLVVASCSAANFGNLLLLVIPAVCGQNGNPFLMAKTICAKHGLSYASFSMAIGGVYIWAYTHGVMKRSGEIQRRLRQENVGAVACVIDPPPNASVAPEDKKDPSYKTDTQDEISPSAQSAEEHQILVPLLAASTNHHHQQTAGRTNNTLWDKLKRSTYKVMEELTAPPTMGAVIGLFIGVVPWLRSVFVGSTAILRPRRWHNPLSHAHTRGQLDKRYQRLTPRALNLISTTGVRKSEVPPAVVAAIISVRYVTLPLVGVGVVRAARDLRFLPADPLYQYTLMMHFAVPPAMSIGTMAQLYDVGQEECSVILLWTYVVAALALTIWSTFMKILQ